MRSQLGFSLTQLLTFGKIILYVVIAANTCLLSFRLHVEAAIQKIFIEMENRKHDLNWIPKVFTSRSRHFMEVLETYSIQVVYPLQIAGNVLAQLLRIAVDDDDNYDDGGEYITALIDCQIPLKPSSQPQALWIAAREWCSLNLFNTVPSYHTL